jgi:hypothetical protein
MSPSTKVLGNAGGSLPAHRSLCAFARGNLALPRWTFRGEWSLSQPCCCTSSTDWGSWTQHSLFEVAHVVGSVTLKCSFCFLHLSLGFVDPKSPVAAFHLQLVSHAKSISALLVGRALSPDKLDFQSCSDAAQLKLTMAKAHCGVP